MKISIVLKKCVAVFLSAIFTITTVVQSSPAQAQVMSTPQIELPVSGTMLQASQSFTPTLIKGLKIDPQNAFKFDFIMDKGDASLEGQDFEREAYKMIKYFLASLAMPEDDLWVNLSPYEHDRIIPENFGNTEMGRDLLAQDYILKQFTASLMYPEGEAGKKFWEEVYSRVEKSGRNIDIPVNTFNKVWIVPQKGYFYEHDNQVFIADATLKVMLEEDYAAMQKTLGAQNFGLDSLNKGNQEIMSDDAKQLIREIIIPVIEREVNRGENFANLRQIYNAMLLSVWFKKRLKDHILGKAYAGRSQIQGIDLSSPAEIEAIWKKYVDAFKTGVYDYMKEEYDPASQQMIPKKYFSGGMTKIAEGEVNEASLTTQKSIVSSFHSPVNVQVDFSPAMMAKEYKDAWRQPPDTTSAPNLGGAPQKEQPSKVYLPKKSNKEPGSGNDTRLVEYVVVFVIGLVFMFVFLPLDFFHLFKKKLTLTEINAAAPDGIFDLDGVNPDWRDSTITIQAIADGKEIFQDLSFEVGYAKLFVEMQKIIPAGLKNDFKRDVLEKTYAQFGPLNKDDFLTDDNGNGFEVETLTEQEIRLKFMAQFVLDNFDSFASNREYYLEYARLFNAFLAHYRGTHSLIKFMPTIDYWLYYAASGFVKEADTFLERVRVLSQISVPAASAELGAIGEHLRYFYVRGDEIDVQATLPLTDGVLPRLDVITQTLRKSEVSANPQLRDDVYYQGLQILGDVLSSLNVIRGMSRYSKGEDEGAFQKYLLERKDYLNQNFPENGRRWQAIHNALAIYPQYIQMRSFPSLFQSPAFRRARNTLADLDAGRMAFQLRETDLTLPFILDPRYVLENPQTIFSTERSWNYPEAVQMQFLRLYEQIIDHFGYAIDANTGYTYSGQIPGNNAMMNVQQGEQEWNQGGVNLRSDQADIQIMESVNGFKFPAVDPAVLSSDNMSVVPVILKIETIPLERIPQMLGLNADEHDKPKSADRHRWPLSKAREVSV